MAPLFGFYDYEAHFGHQRRIEKTAPVIRPRSELKQDPCEIGSPERRHCPLCNVYFGTMNLLETHNRNARSVETPESLVRENLEFALQLRREYVEQLRQTIERAIQEEFEMQEKKDVHVRLQYEEWLEQCRFQPIVKQAKRVNKNDANSRSSARTTKTPQLRKGPSIGISAIIPGGSVKTAGVGRARPAKVPGTQQITDGVLRSSQSCSHNLVATDRYCPICRIYLSTAARYNKHKNKVHKDFEGDLAEAERKRWEKAERQRLREGEEKRRQDKAKKGQGKGKGKGKPQPLQSLTRIFTGKAAKHCGGCQITFDTDGLFKSHISKYRELRLSHRPAFPHPNRGVVVKQLLRILREEPGSEWNRRPKSAVKAGIELPQKGFDRMKKRTRTQRKVLREKREREEFCEQL